MDSDPSPAGRICDIWVYPVKSMQGERATSATLDRSGISGDRQLAVRDLSTGKILSAKAPSIGRALLTCQARQDPGSEQVVVTVGSREFRHVDDSTQLNDALAELLDRPVALAGAGDEGETYASEWPELDDMALSGVELDMPLPSGSFADVAPLQMLTTASLAHLASLMPTADLDLRRFRPSMVIDTVDRRGFVENHWAAQRVRLGEALLEFGPASPRCVMTTLSQPSLAAEPGVLRTLAAHNKLDYAGFGNFACLGVYADVIEAGTIHVGDELVVS